MRGKVVLITGGTRGLGKAAATLLAAEGAAVIVTSRKIGKARVAGDAKGFSGQIVETSLDVGSESSVHDLFQWLDGTFGRLDVLVNNAGIGLFKPLVETTLEEWNTVISTNLTGVFLCAREAFRRMKKQGGGRIINLGSVADYLPLPANGAYGASKFGVRGLTQVLNEEGKHHSIRASLVSPGAVYTEIWHGREGFEPRDMLDPDDVARTILDIAVRPLHVRIDEVKLMPPRGVL